MCLILLCFYRLCIINFHFTDNTPSYLDWVQLGYNRLPGFQKIQRNDIVVFNWPTDNLQKNMPFDKKQIT